MIYKVKIDNTSIINSTQRIPDKAPEDSQKLMEVCKQFESVFINMMLKQMRSTVGDGGLTEKSHGREIFESMYDETLSDEIASGQGIGLAKDLYKQLTAYQKVTYKGQDE
ncbi:rod-binding protein [Alkaliphilus peptidifermentans]|uniref:Flagellar protein FlgJ n=1 Tax=Alkaliphilus peptidifermentans DSM 18978 TaxID=1120976 RepID=A0A1G5JG75_9FIRM|nr:rod-binding protein [Alkaliphilus peptidifermentans]SCY87154.1 flagellar protein FlgJ [Alkaliphilus peptidifermentans DSM 18978]